MATAWAMRKKDEDGVHPFGELRQEIGALPRESMRRRRHLDELALATRLAIPLTDLREASHD